MALNFGASLSEPNNGPTKWLLDYSMAIQTKVAKVSGGKNEFIYINPPITLEFDIQRNDLGSANSATFRIYNLSPKTRNLIRLDQWDFLNQKNIQLIAGYNPLYSQTPFRGITPDGTSYANLNLPMIFSGIMQRAYSEREGDSFVTTITALDNGLSISAPDISRNYSAGNYTNKQIISDLVSYLSQFGVTAGSIGKFTGSPSRGVSYSGKATNLLGQITNKSFFVDLSQLNCLNDDECLDTGSVEIINSKSGLLNTPQLQNNRINLNMIFSPEFRVAQQVKLDSSTAPDANSLGEAVFNQFCRIKSVSHKGIISDSVGGATTTSLILQPGTFAGIKAGSV